MKIKIPSAKRNGFKTYLGYYVRYEDARNVKDCRKVDKDANAMIKFDLMTIYVVSVKGNRVVENIFCVYGVELVT